MFANQPFYPMIFALLAVGVTYFLVRNKKKSIKYGLTTLSILLNFSFLYLWLEKVVFLMTSTGGGFQRFKDFSRFVDLSYFVLHIPLLLLFAWYGTKTILLQDQYRWLKVSFIFFYLGALIGLLFLGQFLFSLLYYGVAP